RADDAWCAGAPARLVRRAKGRLRDRNPAPSLDPLVPQLEREGRGTEHGSGARPAAGERRPLLVPDDGRDRDDARAAGRRLAVLPPSPAAAAAVAVVLRRGRAR